MGEADPSSAGATARGSRSTSTGRSASPSAPIATSTATSGRIRRSGALAGRAAARARPLRGAAAAGAGYGSVFFGGGTPSLMPPETAAAVIERAAARWSLAEDAEINLEANPTSTEAARLQEFRAAGVNRVSLGVQALDDRALAFLGRGHDAAEARQAVAMAQRIMPRSSFDLIYARPGQSVGTLGAPSWQTRLRSPTTTSRSISLPSRRARPSTGWSAMARSRCPDDDAGARALRPDAGDDDPSRLSRPTRSPTTNAAGTPAATISLTGAMTTTWASGRAPTAASGLREAHDRPRASTRGRKPGSPPWSATATAPPRPAPSTPTSRRARC